MKKFVWIGLLLFLAGLLLLFGWKISVLAQRGLAVKADISAVSAK